MKAKVGLAVLALFFIGGMYSFLVNQIGVDQRVDKTYLLPLEFEGCVVINYNVKGALPLKIENNEIIYKVPKDGIIDTFSPSDWLG